MNKLGISNRRSTVTRRQKAASRLVMACLFLLMLAGCGNREDLGDPQAMSSPATVGAIDKIADFSPTVADDGSEPQVAGAPEDIRPRIGSNNRLAVVYECWFALRQSWLTTPDAEGPHGGPSLFGWTVGNWSYLASDPNAFNKTRDIYRSNSSVAANFGLTNEYALKNGYTRGGQCVFFSALILRRALGYQLVWSWKNTPSTSDRSAREAQPGDLIYLPGKHLGICVKNLSDGKDVVDSNWVGYGDSRYAVGYYGGKYNSELVGRHIISNASIDREGWKCYSGAGRWY